MPQLPSYEVGSALATRKAYGEALKALGAARPGVVVLDGEVSNSTFAEDFAKAYPDRFFEMYIAEQQMVAAAVGLSVRHWKPFASTFAAFFTRAYDFIRMAAVSQANIRLVGSHAGVSIGEDGPSQMALEDLAMMRAVLAARSCIPAMRTRRPNWWARWPIWRASASCARRARRRRSSMRPTNSSLLAAAKSCAARTSDEVTVVAAGITLHESLKAYDQLKGKGMAIRVIDAYSVKPIDARTLLEAARATGGRVVVVEDHWIEGGLGDAVLEALAGAGLSNLRVTQLAVTKMPGSGKPEELMAAAGIDAAHIVEAVQAFKGAPVASD